MKALISSDWHLDWSTLGEPRFGELAALTKQLVTAAVENECTHFFFLGDLCDPDRSQSVFRCVGQAINVAIDLSVQGVESHWIAGNHDVVEDGHGTTTLTPLRLLEDRLPGAMVYVHERPRLVELFDDLNLLALPFTSVSHSYDPAEFVRGIGYSNPPDVIVLGHLSLKGYEPGEETNEMPRGRNVDFPFEALGEYAPNVFAFNGHYHRSGSQTHAGVTVHVPGALGRLTFGEQRHEPSYLLVDFG